MTLSRQIVDFHGNIPDVHSGMGEKRSTAKEIGESQQERSRGRPGECCAKTEKSLHVPRAVNSGINSCNNKLSESLEEYLDFRKTKMCICVSPCGHMHVCMCKHLCLQRVFLVH